MQEDVFYQKLLGKKDMTLINIPYHDAIKKFLTQSNRLLKYVQNH
jgi:hypothetical protein